MSQPTRRYFFMLIIALAGIAGAIAFSIWWGDPASNPVTINNTSVPPVPPLDPDVVARGARLYTQFCAACDGANLEGAIDWEKSLSDQLSIDEIEEILDFIGDSWGKDERQYQWWLTVTQGNPQPAHYEREKSILPGFEFQMANATL